MSAHGDRPIDGVDLALPELHLADWRSTKDTLHRYCQILGKVRMATTAPKNHWWHVPLYVDVRGLTTRRMHYHGVTFQIRLDFVEHELIIETSDGRTETWMLGDGLSVAAFDARLHTALGTLGIDVAILEEPFGIDDRTPFPEDTEHATWDQDAVERYARVLDWSDRVLDEFSGWFAGKTSPVHLFWHSLDLAVTRFSGRPAPAIDADPVTREAYGQEVISFGFWAGDDTVGDAAYYSYTAPEPDGLRDQPLTAGSWTQAGAGALAVLPYETVRTAAEPKAVVLGFCQSAYEAGARLAGWDAPALESSWCPTPSQLDDLRAGASLPMGQPPVAQPKSR
jgi:hypothetical protein